MNVNTRCANDIETQRMANPLIMAKIKKKQEKAAKKLGWSWMLFPYYMDFQVMTHDLSVLAYMYFSQESCKEREESCQEGGEGPLNVQK